jgi:hypothetical protein
MLTPDEANILSEAVKKRNKKYYAWMRHLILLASGALTVLVSLHSDQQLSAFPLRCMKTAWVSLGIGILLGSVCLHGEVKSSAETVRLLAKGLSGPHPGNITVHVRLPARYRLCEYVCYVSLICAVVSLVLYAVTRY